MERQMGALVENGGFQKSNPGAKCRCLPPARKLREVLESTDDYAHTVTKCPCLRRKILADC